MCCARPPLSAAPRVTEDIMIRIAVTPTAFTAIAATLSVGSVSFEAETGEKGQRLIWLDEVVVERLAAMRQPGESYSDVIMRLVETEPH